MRGGIIGMSSRLGLTIRAESHSVEHNVTQILEHLYLGGEIIRASLSAALFLLVHVRRLAILRSQAL